MNVQPQVKREIKLSPALTFSIRTAHEEIAKLQSEIQIKNKSVVDMLTGVTLSSEFDTQNEGIYLSADFTSILIYDLPKKETPQEDTLEDIDMSEIPDEPKRKAIRKQLN